MKRHEDQNKFKCEKCEYGSYDRNAFENHKANHLVEEGLAERAHCPECGKGFNSEFYLRNHMDNVHPVDGTKYYRCPMCDLVFKQPNARKLHVERDHKGSAHPCDRDIVLCCLEFSEVLLVFSSELDVFTQIMSYIMMQSFRLWYKIRSSRTRESIRP